MQDPRLVALGSRIRQTRESRGMDANQLADRASMSPSTVSNYENGKKEPSSLRLGDIADVLGCSVDYLLGRSKEPDMRNTTPRGWAIVDDDQVRNILEADTDAEIDALTVWPPDALRWASQVPENFSLYSLQDYAAIDREINDHIDGKHPNLEKRWAARAKDQWTLFGPINAWVRRKYTGRR